MMMVEIYVKLITEKLKTINQVPQHLRDEVRNGLIEYYVKLITENLKTIEEVPEYLKESVENRLKKINDDEQ